MESPYDRVTRMARALNSIGNTGEPIAITQKEVENVARGGS